MQRFCAVVDHPTHHEIHHAIGEHLGVDPERTVVTKRRKKCVRHSADSELQGVPVLHKPGNVFSDRQGIFIESLSGKFRKLVIDLDRKVDRGRVYERIAVGSRHLRVHLGDNDGRGFERWLYDVHRHPERTEPVCIGRSDLHERDVHWHGPAKERCNLTKEHRGEIRFPFVHGRASVGSNKKSVVPQPSRKFRLKIGSLVEREKMTNLHITDL